MLNGSVNAQSAQHNYSILDFDVRHDLKIFGKFDNVALFNKEIAKSTLEVGHEIKQATMSAMSRLNSVTFSYYIIYQAMFGWKQHNYAMYFMKHVTYIPTTMNYCFTINARKNLREASKRCKISQSATKI